MKLPTYSDVEAAASRLSGHVVHTPLVESQILNERLGARIFLKAECLQHTGSFKFRGAFNALKKLKASNGNGKVVAMSSGNHAQGVAEAARLLGFSSTIVMPADAPAIKQARTKRSGAEVVTYDRYKQDREEVARQVAEDVGAPIIHPYDDPEVISGQGTAGLEAAQQLEELGLGCDRVLVCAGGGGLMTGIMLAMKHHFPNVSIHPVEPLGYDDHAQSIKTGERCSVDTSRPSICDAILAPAPGKLAFELGKGNLAPGLVISDDDALAAVAFAFNELKIVVEPGGAAALAALLTGKIDVSGETVVATLSGGNIDQAMLRRALDAQGGT